MKKRTVKDFVALYAPEDEEKLVLIQDGVSAVSYTHLDVYKRQVQDAGGFYDFYREDGELGVELSFSGSFVGGQGDTVTVYDAVFYPAGTVKRGSYVYDEPKKEDLLPLGRVEPRYFSEIVYQLQKATASSSETNPNWRSER